MTSGDGSGTSGGKSVTSGRRFEWHPVAITAAVGVVIAVVNATSKLMEARSMGLAEDPRGHWVFEITSVIMVVVLAPLIGWAVRRFPPGDGRWPAFAIGHTATSTVFAMGHIAGMVLLRIAAYATVGKTYTFEDDGDFVFPFIYEWRKDLLTYAAIGSLYWGWSFWLAQRAAEAVVTPEAPASDSRIELRDGSRVFLVEPGDIVWIEAAGNYVEVHVGATRHLLRGTLAAFAERLAGRGFVRVHRSRLVNRARVKALQSTPSGDFEITLDDGRTLAGSRRYRAGMDAV